MKSSTVPMICGIALAAMSAAGVSHWWSVDRFDAAFHAGLPVPASVQPAPTPAVSTHEATVVLATQAPSSPATTAAAEPAQKNFYEALIKKMENLQNQNRDLLDQMAETNRDVMKMEFRLDTHSESFRPMPVNDDRPDTSFDDGPGVLPPRAEPVFPASDE